MNFIAPNESKKQEDTQQAAKVRSIMGCGKTKVWKPDKIVFSKVLKEVF